MNDMHNSQRGFFGIPPKNTFFAPDDGDGGTQPPAATESEAATTRDGTGGDGAADSTSSKEKVYSQAEFEAAFGPRAARAKETAVKSLLSELNFDSKDDLAAFLADARTKADAELSELERLQNQIGELEPQAASATTIQETLDKYEEQVSERVKILVEELKIPDYVTSLLDSMSPLQQLEYINNNRDAFKATPPPPNTNAGQKGGKAGANGRITAVRTKYGIPKRHNRR